MDTNSTQEEAAQDEKRFLWENEEEATEMEMESIGFSSLSLVTGMMIIVISVTLLIIF